MMRLPTFKYFAPGSAAEAAKILANEGPRAQLVAGGTDLYPNMKRRHEQPQVLVGLRAIPDLRGVRGTPKEGLVLGAGTTLTALERHPAVVTAYPALAHAVATISTPLLRNMGTIGGNVCLDTRCTYYNQNYEWRRAINFCMKCEGETCWVAPSSDTCLAVNSSDTSPLLCALGATVRLVSGQGEREVPVSGLYRNDGITYLNKNKNEVLTEIALPATNGWRATYRKVRRRGAFDFPVLGVAAVLWQEGDGTVTDAKIYLNGVASAPIHLDAAEQALIGHRLTPERIEAAARLAYRPARAFDNTDLDNRWRKQMAPVQVRRALETLTG